MLAQNAREIAQARPSTHDSVIIDWQLSSYFGWGVIGVHFMLNWALQHGGKLLTTMPVNESVIDLGPVEWRLIRPSIQQSRELQTRLEPLRGQPVTVNFPVLHALGDDFVDPGAARGSKLQGQPDIALPVFESTAFSAAGIERAKSYAMLVAASSWNRSLMVEAGLGPAPLALQGVDQTTFHPAPRAGWFENRFAVFSGGKLEYRKGQDLVLRAFRAFSQRHADALLVTAWASPWPGIARSFAAVPGIEPVPFTPDGNVDVSGWIVANGIAPNAFIDLGAVPNSAMARLYREMDIGLFPNRCEGGTNIVAMECLACGVPLVLSRNTGHFDLIEPDRCFALERQTPIEGGNRIGWGESDVEEIVETLEIAYQNRAERLARGRRGAEFMRGMTWGDTVRTLTDILLPLL